MTIIERLEVLFDYIDSKHQEAKAECEMLDEIKCDIAEAILTLKELTD